MYMSDKGSHANSLEYAQTPARAFLADLAVCSKVCLQSKYSLKIFLSIYIHYNSL